MKVKKIAIQAWWRCIVLASCFNCWFGLAEAVVHAQDHAGSVTELDESTAVDGAGDVAKSPNPAPPKLPEPKGAERLSRDYDIWLDQKQGAVIIDGQISLREGMLEMFACTRNTKEHESIVSANTKAFLVHAALLRLGAESGTPVEFVPAYKPPTGSEIEVSIEWLDEAGNRQTARAQDWVQDVRTKQAMAPPFVFAGSRFWTDPESGKQYYQAEGGDFICVSNFGTAMLDIPVPSSQANDELAYQAFTERIPPLGSQVRLFLKPILAAPATKSEQQRPEK
jgi:hypothetical protein